MSDANSYDDAVRDVEALPKRRANDLAQVPERKPTQYALLHHAAAFARQLEAAGLPEAQRFAAADDDPDEFYFEFAPGDGDPNELWIVRVWPDGAVNYWRQGSTGRYASFRVGAPLPAALVAAIKATAP